MMLDLDVGPFHPGFLLRQRYAIFGAYIIIINYCWGKCTSVQLGCVCFVIFAYVLLLNTLSDGYYLN